MQLDVVLDLVADSPTQRAGDGERILVEGERSNSIFVLVDGELEVRQRGRAVVRITEPGSIVGEIGLLLDQPANADVVAVGTTTLRRVDDGEELFGRHPELMRHVATMLAGRLHQVSTYLADMQEQFADRSETLGLVPTVLRELLDNQRTEIETGSEREPDSPY